MSAVRLTHVSMDQYFKSIENVARDQGFEQILPSSIRTGPNVKTLQPIIAQPIPTTVVDSGSPTSLESPAPTILSPQPLTSRFLRASSPANEYPVRSVSPADSIVFDRMADRIHRTPNPEVQMAQTLGVH